MHVEQVIPASLTFKINFFSKDIRLWH